jgi:hypothetical protein
VIGRRMGGIERRMAGHRAPRRRATEASGPAVPQRRLGGRTLGRHAAAHRVKPAWTAMTMLSPSYSKEQAELRKLVESVMCTPHKVVCVRGRVSVCLSIRVVRPSCFLPLAPFITARPGAPWCHAVAIHGCERSALVCVPEVPPRACYLY